jgi:hypothetical protein
MMSIVGFCLGLFIVIKVSLLILRGSSIRNVCPPNFILIVPLSSVKYQLWHGSSIEVFYSMNLINLS